MGVLIGALTLGSALPHLIGGLWRLDWRAVLAGLPVPGGPGIDAFLVIGVAGLAGCLIGGWTADRTTVTRGDGIIALDGTAVCYTTAIPAAHPHDRR
jgi:hypothetical protein